MAAWKVIAIVLALATHAGLQALAAPQVDAQPPVSREEIEQLIQRLDAVRFDEREAAAQRLAEIGEPVIEPLVAAVRGASRERLARTLSVLVKLALGKEGEIAEKAEAAVEAIAEGAEARAARIAHNSLDAIHRARADQARDALIALGALIGEIRAEDLNGEWRLFEDAEFVELGPQFRGQISDLKHLRRLTGVYSVTLSLPTADDAFLEAIVKQMPQLREVNIKRAKVTSKGLAQLQKLPRLHHLWICYLPVDEAGVAELSKLPVLSYLTLFGTRVTEKQEQDLVAAHPNTRVDVRAGAFLGLGGATSALGFRVTSVSPGSAAEKNGIRVDDTIQRVDGKPIASIKDLTQTLKTRSPGDRVTVELINDDASKKIEVTLGEWP